MNFVVFLGPAGSGKGTQASYLQDNFGYAHISTGDLLRSEVAKQSDIGKIVDSIIGKGDLVSDEIILQIIQLNLDRLINDENCNGIIFDGFPRTKEQAVALDDLVATYQLKLSRVFYFDLSLEESINRISGRLIDSRDNTIYHKESNPPTEESKPFLITREDDVPEKVKYRYTVYQESTEPLLDYYKDRLVRLDCRHSIEIINESLSFYIDQLAQAH